MLAEERFSRILSILRERGFAKVEELATILRVSDMTVRRDLEKCQEAGKVIRCHGGALLVGVNQQEISFDDKSAENAAVKKRLAATCATFVDRGMTVFLDAGTTTYEIAQAIRSVPGLTIITNDIRIAYSLLNSSVELLLIGGEVQKTTGSMIGCIADQMAEGMRFDLSFFGVAAIDESLDVMTPTSEKMRFKKQVLRGSSSGYIVSDHSKFRRRALHRINNLGDYMGTVTDCEFNDQEKEIIKEKGICVIPVA